MQIHSIPKHNINKTRNFKVANLHIDYTMHTELTLFMGKSNGELIEII